MFDTVSNQNIAVFEIGPALLVPTDGSVIAFGATGHTAIYAPNANPALSGTWTAGPDFPADPGDPSNGNKVLSPTGLLTLSNTPGCLQPNGRVLVVAGTLYRNTASGIDFFSKNSQYFEYEPVGGDFSPNCPPNHRAPPRARTPGPRGFCCCRPGKSCSRHRNRGRPLFTLRIPPKAVIRQDLAAQHHDLPEHVDRWPQLSSDRPGAQRPVPGEQLRRRRTDGY